MKKQEDQTHICLSLAIQLQNKQVQRVATVINSCKKHLILITSQKEWKKLVPAIQAWGRL